MSSLLKSISSDLFDTIEHIVEVSEHCALVQSRLLECYKQVMTQFVNILATAGYDSFPCPLPLSSSRGIRLTVDRRKDELRAVTLRLRDFPLKLDGEMDARESTGEDACTDIGVRQEQEWRELYGVDSPSMSSSDSMAASVVSEICIEHLNTSVSLVTALLACANDVKNRAQSCVNRLRSMARQRYRYEHDMLRKWSAELKKACEPPKGTPPVTRQRSGVSVTSSSTLRSKLSTPPAEPYGFLSSYYFGVSDDVQHDGVKWVTAGSAVDLGDMRLPLNVVALLATELMKAIKNVVVITNQVHVDVVISTVKALVDRGVQMPITWRQAKRIQSFVSRLIGGFNITPLELTRTLILTLVLGQVSRAPSSDYILRVGHHFAIPPDAISDRTFHFNEEYRLKLDKFINVVMSEPLLSEGWWRENIHQELSSEEKERVLVVLKAVATTCLDSSGRVIVEDLMLLLCKTPSTIESLQVEHTFVLTPAGLARENDDVQTMALGLPPFLKVGLHKASRIALRTAATPTSLQSHGRGIAPPKPVLVDPSKHSDGAIAGVPSLTQHQLGWLLHNAEYNSGDSKAWLDIKDYWRTEQLSHNFEMQPKLVRVSQESLADGSIISTASSSVSKKDKIKQVGAKVGAGMRTTVAEASPVPMESTPKVIFEKGNDIEISLAGSFAQICSLLGSDAGLKLLKSSKFDIMKIND